MKRNVLDIGLLALVSVLVSGGAFAVPDVPELPPSALGAGFAGLTYLVWRFRRRR